MKYIQAKARYLEAVRSGSSRRKVGAAMVRLMLAWSDLSPLGKLMAEPNGRDW